MLKTHIMYINTMTEYEKLLISLKTNLLCINCSNSYVHVMVNTQIY